MLKLAGEFIEGQLADHIARLDAHTKNPREVFRTGEYMYPFLISFKDISQVSATADTLYAVPFLVARDMTVDRIAIYVATLAAGKSARLGIYRDGTNLYPGDLLLDAGEVSVASSGLKAITIDQALTKGIYWLAIVSDGAPVIRAAAFTVQTVLGLGVGFGATDPQTGWSVSYTYAALPDPFTAGGSFTTQHNKFLICLRLKTLD